MFDAGGNDGQQTQRSPSCSLSCSLSHLSRGGTTRSINSIRTICEDESAQLVQTRPVSIVDGHNAADPKHAVDVEEVYQRMVECVHSVNKREVNREAIGPKPG